MSQEDPTLQGGSVDQAALDSPSEQSASGAAVSIQGVDKLEAPGGESGQLTERQRLIENLADRAQEGWMAEEGLQVAVEEPGGTPHLETPAPADPTPAGGLPDQLVLQDDGSYAIRQKIDGEELLVPFDKAVAGMQKAGAADRRLQFASQRLSEVEEREKALLAPSQQPPGQGSPPPSEGVDPSLVAEARDVVNGLLTLPEDEAAEKLARMMSSRAIGATPTQAPDIRAIATAVSAQTAETDGYKAFMAEYTDVAADSALYNMADSYTSDIAVANPDWTPREVMFAAGDRVREWVASKTGASEPQNPNVAGPATPQGKAGPRAALKDQLQPMPLARAGVAPTDESVDPNLPDSPSDVIAGMRRARGQVS